MIWRIFIIGMGLILTYEIAGILGIAVIGFLVATYIHAVEHNWF